MIPSFLAIPVLLCAAFLIPIAGVHKKKLVPYIAIVAVFISFISALLTISPLLTHADKVLTMQMGGWQAPYGITIVVDQFSLMIITLVTFVGFLAVIFSKEYIKYSKPEYYTLLCLLLAGLMGMAHSGDIFNLFVFLEITSLSSYALTAFYTEKKSCEASIKYLIMGAFATSFVLLGIAFTYGLTGTLNMADIAIAVNNNPSPTISIIIGLLLTGLALKCAIVPLHAWKPDVIEAAPIPVGAVFASVSTATCLYAIIRILYTVFDVHLTVIMLTAGAITMLTGAILAMQQDNILRLLAYSAISQVGYIMIAFATDTTSAIFHLFNVTIIEALLFFSIGALTINTKEASMTKLSAMNLNPHKIIPAAFFIGALSNAGVPLLNGFSSKWLIYITTLETYPLITIAAVLTSALTLAYSLKAYYMIFRSTGHRAGVGSKIDLAVFIPLILLIIICVYFGIFAAHGEFISQKIAGSLADNGIYIQAVLNR